MFCSFLAPAILTIEGRFVRRPSRLSAAAAVVIAVLQTLATAACAFDEDVVKRQFLAAGDRFAGQRQFKEAVLEYRNAVQIDPMFAEARTRLAATYEQSGDTANAFREYVRAADLSPADVALQLNRESLIRAYVVEADNLESIHNHSAFARLARSPDAGS